MKFTAVGDILCQKRLARGYRGFEEIKSFIEQGDARFFNLETTVNREGECYGNQFSGGTYIRCNPEVAADMLEFGFNLTTFNNNHAMDFAHEGLIKTIENMDALGIVHGGVGMNLDSASAPVYLETPEGRVALIATNTSFNPALMAGAQSRRIKGRPGINGINITRKIVVPKEDFENIKRIGELSEVNAPKNVTRAEGYYPYPPEDVAELGDMLFKLGDSHGLLYEPKLEDVERVKASIREAKLSADYVMLSIHSHQLVGSDKTTVPDFLKMLAHEFIDAGADAIVGHGPHLLRAIEVYRERPIFYSLGDFLIELYDVPIAPEDFYKSYGMTSASPTIELLRRRSADFSRGLMEDRRMLESVIPFWETERDGTLRSLILMPVKASKGESKGLEGLPQPATELGFIEDLAKMSKEFGVTIEMKDGLAYCKW